MMNSNTLQKETKESCEMLRLIFKNHNVQNGHTAYLLLVIQLLHFKFYLHK